MHPLAFSPSFVRNLAIEHHHHAVHRFQSYYTQLEADRFANAFGYGRHKIQAAFEEALQSLPSQATVLDIGCGTGPTLHRLQELGFVPVGLEPAQGMLETARRANPGIKVIEGVATHLPFEDASFHCVSAFEVYRYLHREDIRLSLREVLRVLKPGGFFFGTLVNRWALDGFFLFQRGRQLLLRKECDTKHPHCEFFSPREAEQEFLRVGFGRVRVFGKLFAPVRLAYKAHPRIGSWIAKHIEAWDDRIHEHQHHGWLTPYAGHLLVHAERIA